MVQTILTKEFCIGAIRKSKEKPKSMTVEETRYVTYFSSGYGHEDECIDEGSMMLLTCNNINCIRPDHVKMFPPTIIKGNQQ